MDDGLVAEVAQALDTDSTEETVRVALNEVLANRRRAMAIARLRVAASDGAFDLDLLEDKQNYRF